MSAPVSTPKQWSRGNEVAQRSHVEDELAQKHDRRSDLIIPPGFRLGFAGVNGEEVVFGLDGSGVFTIKVNDDPVIEIATDGDVSAVLSLLANSIAFTVDGSGRAASFKLLSDGTTSDIEFKADAFKFFDGLTDRALIDAAGGVFTINGDVAVTGSIVVGNARLKVGFEPLEFSKEDAETIQWAGGVSIGSAPKYNLDVSAAAALTAGEQYDVRLTGVTNTGATLRAKILTPGTTAAQSETTDAAGGMGDPDRVMEKPTAGDAYNAVYGFTISGTVDVVSTFDGESGMYINTGGAEFSTWFDDGGGWDEGPSIAIYAHEVVGYFSVGDETGAQSFEMTYPIDWSQAIGNSGASGYEFGVSHESGGSLVDLDEVTYTTQTSSGERSATPDGEKIKITAYPRNQ